MMPNWLTPSEVWLQRMLHLLEPDLGAILAGDTKGSTSWQGRVRAVSLAQRSYSAILYGILKNKKRMPGPNAIVLREVERPAITHILCHYGAFAVNFLDVWRACQKPLFVHFHGFDATFDIRRDDQPEVRHHAGDYLDRVQELAQYATFIANSEFTRAQLQDAGIPAGRIVVKYFGVPLPTRGKTHTPHEALHIVQLGRLVDFKSPDRTIQAFEQVRAQGIAAQLTLAGDGPLRITCELLKARSPYKDSIHLPGAVSPEQAQDLLADADIYTQHNIEGEVTRQSEAFGVSVLEAMAHSLPVVATRNGGVMETVVDKETGYLGTPGSVEEQAGAIIRLAQDASLRQQLGQAGRKRVETCFNLDAENRRLREIMNLRPLS